MIIIINNNNHITVLQPLIRNCKLYRMNNINKRIDVVVDTTHLCYKLSYTVVNVV
ncbi:Orf139 [Heliothis zea nudivirus]|uniref:Orf139 n=1 Tax=Heliothis zea nudivirus 1 TaxID=3116536 RepID=Q8JKH4_9VIRU|nr:Orf139 [Heliothis zea nudivirus]AAN04431.1 Orf139 [Heliothis zea nudivirus]